MAKQKDPTSLLGTQIGKRLNQLGMSRREFCRRYNISRQTLHELEHNPTKEFAPSTFKAIDDGLKWKAGTAIQFHQGNPKAREDAEGPTEERMHQYLNAIMQQLVLMDIDELEREVLMLEEEAYGRSARGNGDITSTIDKTIQQLVNELLHSKTGKRRSKVGNRG